MRVPDAGEQLEGGPGLAAPRSVYFIAASKSSVYQDTIGTPNGENRQSGCAGLNDRTSAGSDPTYAEGTDASREPDVG